jgi:hypothetical protein
MILTIHRRCSGLGEQKCPPKEEQKRRKIVHGSEVGSLKVFNNSGGTISDNSDEKAQIYRKKYM